MNEKQAEANMRTESEIRELLQGGETIAVEFKGEEHGGLNDTNLVLAIVCIANTDGGTLLIGVEDDGRITGARARHASSTDADRLVALVRSRTVPPLQVNVTVHALL
jgi:ATP-dependent DNA helicase RecG